VECPQITSEECRDEEDATTGSNEGAIRADDLAHEGEQRIHPARMETGHIRHSSTPVGVELASLRTGVTETLMPTWRGVVLRRVCFCPTSWEKP